MNNLYLDHVAIAVRDLEESKKIYRDIGFEFSAEEEVVASQKVKTAFAAINQGSEGISKIELLMPTSEESTIHQFIQKKGEGIHHLCFSVEDVSSKQKELEEKGYRFIYPTPIEGAGHCLVNFIHPKSAKGVLIELSQKLAGK